MPRETTGHRKPAETEIKLEGKEPACKKRADRQRAVYKLILLLVSVSHHSKLSLFRELVIPVYILINHSFQLKSLITFFGVLTI